jgi:hypothetical protein
MHNSMDKQSLLSTPKHIIYLFLNMQSLFQIWLNKNKKLYYWEWDKEIQRGSLFKCVWI